ncbi:hypothetical Protein psc1_05070 [Candidatus Phytoplasma solani]
MVVFLKIVPFDIKKGIMLLMFIFFNFFLYLFLRKKIKKID